MTRTAFAACVTIPALLCACGRPDLALAPPGEPSATAVLTRVDLGTLGGPSSVAAAINKYDVVVGTSQTANGARHAFRWSATDGMTDLGTLPGDRESEAVAILDGGGSDDGNILGVSGEDGHWTAVLWSASGARRALPIPQLPNSTAGKPTGFNIRGQVVGWDLMANQHAWIWSQLDGKYDLTANLPGGSTEGAAAMISASGAVLLTTQATTCHLVTECWRTYVWSAATGYSALGTPDGDPDVAVTGLGANESGSIVGWLTRGEGGSAAYRWDARGGFTILPHYSNRGVRQGYATAINSNGTVVGAETDPSSGAFVAALWPSKGGVVRLSPYDPSVSVAVAINDVGTVAGWAAVAENANHAVIWTSRDLNIPSGVVANAIVRTNALIAPGHCLAQIRSGITRERVIECGMSADE